MNKNPFIAFFLAFIPGWGHFYLDKKGRFALYGTGFWFSLFIAIVADIVMYGDEFFIVFGLLALFVWGINMVDIVVTLLSRQWTSTAAHEIKREAAEEGSSPSLRSAQDERFLMLLLSIIPGLGHFQLGLMQRGLTLMIAFFGLAMMVLFVAILSGSGGFLVFLGVLPIIWIYSIFDAVQQFNRQQRGETLTDRTIFEEFEQAREHGKKSKMIATLLAVFPGAGHMYLGLQRRGLQFMAAFLFSIYILDVLQLSLFLFVIPIIWFYNFFDALQQVSKHGSEELTDQPLVGTFINQQRWIGFGLLAVGAYYLLDNVFLPVFDDYFSSFFGIHMRDWYDEYFQTTIVSIILIGGGLKLLFGSKKKGRNADK